MFSINSLLDMGSGALFASQTALQVTGENISNVNTDGYSRRTVRFEESFSIDTRPGQMGTGVNAAEVVRHFDRYIEEQYLEKNSTSERWNLLYENLSQAESLFNESQGYGLSESISQFFSAWTDLSQRPEDYGSRRSLLNDSETLVSTLRQTDADLALMQERTDDRIRQNVEDANELMKQIAELNKQLSIHDVPGSNNANQLYDERASLVRNLGQIMDVDVIDNGGADFIVTTQAGQTLVDGLDHFSLNFESAQAMSDLGPDSNFEGQIYWEGNDSYEYTIEFTNNGQVSNGSGPGAGTFRVSLDGGNTWLKNEEGHIKEFQARPKDGKVNIEGLNIWFGTTDSDSATPTGNFAEGDTFTIVPKSGIYWVQNTSHKENITPQIQFDGEDDTRRLTGGSLAAYFNFRDEYVGEYRDKLDSLAETMIWEVNRRHSQGVGLERFTFLEGNYSVARDDLALGSDSTGLFFGNRLNSGSSMVYVYDAATGNVASSAALDFDPATPGQQNFDPTQHSLNDVAAAYNNTFGGLITASVVDHRIRLETQTGYEMAWGTDTTGLNAALGINTFFSGDSAENIVINDTVGSQVDYLCTGHVNGAMEGNQGDNTTAKAISDLSSDNVEITTVRDGTTSQSILNFYNGLVGVVGTDVATSNFNAQYNGALAQDLNDRQQEVSGVNLDEEMTSLIKFQHSYSAAAKLITTADQMMQTVLSLKP